MKQFRWVWILGIAAVLLTVIFLVLDHRSKKIKEKDTSEPKQLLSIDADSVRRITIDNEEGHFAFDWDDSAGWQLVSSEQFKINNYAISGICTYICDVWSQKTVAFDCQNTSVYGFDNPVTLKVFTTDTDAEHPYILYVGDMTPTRDAFYAMVDGSDDVYTISQTSGEIFCASKDTLKNTYLFDYRATEVMSYRLERGGKVITEIGRDADENFMLITPAGYDTYKNKIDDLMNTIIRVKMSALIEEHPQDLARYGLDNPQTKLFLEADDGKKFTEEIWFGGDAAGSTTEIYGYLKSMDQVFTVLRADVSFIDYSAKQYIFPYCTNVNIGDVASVEIDMGEVYDLHDTLTLENESKHYTLGGKQFDASEDEQLYGQVTIFFRSISYLPFDDIDLDAKPENDPAMRIAFTFTDGKQQVLEFTKKAENEFYLFKDGSYTGQTVRLKAFTGTSGVIQAHSDLLDMVNKQN